MQNNQFGGMHPGVSRRLLPEHGAQRAENCWIRKGDLNPLPTLNQISGVNSFSAAVQSIFLYDGDGSGGRPYRFFQWSEDVDVVRSPIINDTRNRVIWTGDEYPRHTTSTLVGAFSSPGKPSSRRLGVPEPDPPTVIAGTYTDEDTDSEEAETHVWVMTWLTDLDEEGPPSRPSALITRGFNVDGTILPVTVTRSSVPSGDYGINRWRVYRSNGGAYQLVGTGPVSTESDTEQVLTSHLGEALVSTNWDPPPENLRGLISLPNGVLAGFVGRYMYFSEPYQPHAWPEDYALAFDDDIVGLGAFGVNVVVGTKGRPYIVSGVSPATAAPARLELVQPCASKRSFAYVDEQGIIYASHEGLVLVGPSGARLITEGIYDREQWQALNPAQFKAVYLDGFYVAFNAAKGLAIGRNTGVIDIDEAGVKAVMYHLNSDQVAVVASDARLKEFRLVGNTRRVMKWRSRPWIGRPRHFSAAQVISSGYGGVSSSDPVPVKLRLYVDGQADEIIELELRSNAPVRLPVSGLYSDWEYEVEATIPVVEVRVGRMADMI